MKHSVFERIVVRESRERSYLAKPNQKMLSDFESSHSITLPSDYKDFCLRFGAGELAGYFRIYTVIEGDANATDFDLEKLNESIQIRSFFSLYNQQDYSQQFLIFASDIGGDYYAWGFTDLNNSVGTECAIFHLDGFSITEVASSFTEFVEQGCSRGLSDDLEWKEDWSFRRFFQK